MKKVFLALAVGAVMGSLTLGSSAQPRIARLLGIQSSHDVVESYEMSVGVTPLGTPLRRQKFQDVREELHYPEFLGSLLAVTSHGEKAVLWFQDSNGILRNVVVGHPTSRLFRIEKRPDEKFVVEITR